MTNRRLGAWCIWLAATVTACSASNSRSGGTDLLPPGNADAGDPPASSAPPVLDAAAPPPSACDLPGEDVSGAVLPAGFCIRRFATLGTPRTLLFAPNGDLIVGAPSTATAGGASGGPGQILVLSDDDHDGIAERHVFASDVPDVHGIALGDGYLYFTTTGSVFRTPFAPGQRLETPGAREDLMVPDAFFNGGRWTHGLARSPGGHLYVTRAEYATCGGPGGGEIGEVGTLATTTGMVTSVAKGFRNPMYMRCHPTDEVCAATELGEDLTTGAKEKLIYLGAGTDYGYPCCFGAAAPISAAAAPTMCGQVTAEEASFTLGDTPFGFDWERGGWPAPYRNGIFVARHGSFYTAPAWQGAAIVVAATDPVTHKPTEAWRSFLGGFGPGGSPLERPADVAFSQDGRLFFADDQGGAIYWIAPRATSTVAASTP